MFVFDIEILQSSLEAISDLHSNKTNRLSAKIVAEFGVLGSIELAYVEALGPLSSSNDQQKRLGKDLRETKSKKRNCALPPTNIAKVAKTPAFKNVKVTSGDDNEVALMSKANPDALINVTQNLTTGQKSFQCSLCGYVTSQKGTVKRHIDLKHLPSSTVFRCQTCGLTCNLKFNLKNHYVSKHGLSEEAAKVMVA